VEEPLRECLERFATLAGATLAGTDALAAAMRVVEPPRGADLFRQGEPDGHLYYLHRGLVRLGYLHATGAAHTKSIVAEGGLFGSLQALAAGAPASFSATALEPSVVVKVPYSALEQAMRSDPRWERVARLVLQTLALAKEEREFELLTLTPTQRWARLLDRRPDLVARVSQIELARLIGVTPVALSRIKSRVTRPPNRVHPPQPPSDETTDPVQ
jgi:CRP-like cAMP-binding protein